MAQDARTPAGEARGCTMYPYPLNQGPAVAEVRFPADRDVQTLRMVAAFTDLGETIVFVTTAYADPWDSHPADHELRPVEVNQEGDRLRVVTDFVEVILTPWRPRQDPQMDRGVEAFERYLAGKRRSYAQKRKGGSLAAPDRIGPPPTSPASAGFFMAVGRPARIGRS